jgi:hypothetical protein
MDLTNNLITGLFNGLFWPLKILSPLWALTLVSVLAGLGIIWVFGRVSRQDQIGRVKDQIRGKLFGVRLFQHEIGVVFRLQRQIFRHTLTYLGLSLVPMLVLLIPVFLIIVQLNLHFAHRPLRPGEQAIVKVTLADASLLNRTPLTLKPDRFFAVETSPVRIASEKEIAWRIRAVQPGRHSLKLQLGKEEVEKDVVIGNGWGAVSSLRGTHLLDSLLYPAEHRLDPKSGISAVQLTYPRLPLSLFGWNLDWLVVFLVVSVAASFGLKGLLGVQL